jgi:hypothetical protein
VVGFQQIRAAVLRGVCEGEINARGLRTSGPL